MTTINPENAYLAPPRSRLPGVLALAAVGLGLAVDHAPTVVEHMRQPAETQITYSDNGADRVFLTMPGCRAETSAIAPMLEKKFGEVANTGYMSYAKGKIDIKEVGRSLLEFRDKTDRNKPISILALSMSGITLVRLLDDPAFRERFGSIDSIVFDSAPYKRSHVRLNPQFWLAAATLTQYSQSLGYASKLWQLRSAAKHAGEHSPCITDEEVIAHQRSTILTPAYVVANQGKLIRQPRLSGSLRGVAGEAIYLHGSYDRTIDTDKAAVDYNNVFGGTLKTVVDTARPHGSHAAAPEFPEGSAALLGSDWKACPWLQEYPLS